MTAAVHELAMSVAVDSVFAVPSEQTTWRMPFANHAHHARRSPRILARCEASKSFCWVAAKTDAEAAERIRALNLRGITFKRIAAFLPKRELAAQVLGYAGMDDKGLSGIERQFNSNCVSTWTHCDFCRRAPQRLWPAWRNKPDPGDNVV